MELLNRTPNWIRWILVPVASVLSSFILYTLTTLFYKTGYIFLYTKKFKVAVSILKLVAGVGFEPTMLLAYETGVVT